MTMAFPTTLTLTARCLCNRHVFSHPVPLRELPLRASACHCSSCRHVTGALYSAAALWPGPAPGIDDLASYPFTGSVALRFCGWCGTPVFWTCMGERGEEEYEVFTGVLDNVKHPEGGLVVHLAEHTFVGDTVDGGALGWLRRPHGGDAEPARVWLGRKGGSEEVVWPGRWPADDRAPKSGEVPEEVPVRCRCGGADFVVKVGEMQRESRRVREEEGREWGEAHWRALDPGTQKGMGTFDVCDSCRKGAGVDLVHWTFPYLKFLRFKDGGEGFPGTVQGLARAVEEGGDERFGTLAMYRSSEGVQRYFCGNCSATVFYASDESPDLVDLAIGVLWAPDGARAESMIFWNFGEVYYKEDVVGGWREGMMRAIEEEAEEWRVERGYPKNWRRVKKEEEEAAAKAGKGEGDA